MLNHIDHFFSKFIKHNQSLPLQIDITNSCNLSCQHCYHPDHKNQGNLSLDNWFKIISDYKKLISQTNYTPLILICGGEPLLSPYLFLILDFIKINFKNPKILILTNGTLINDTFIKKIFKYNNIEFQVSLDGPNEFLHDFFRGKNSFLKSIAGIELLIKNNFKVSILSILSKQKECCIEDFFILAKKLNVTSCNFTRLISEGYGKQMIDSDIDHPLEGFALRDAYQKILKYSLKYQVKTDLSKPLMNLILPGLGRNSKYWEGVIVDYKGQILASSRSRLVIGHAIRDGIINVFFKNETLKSLRHGKVETCGSCSEFKVCGGDRNAAYAKNNNFLAADPGCWKNLKLNINANINNKGVHYEKSN